MSSFGDVIPISSRRPAAAPPPRPSVPPKPTGSRVLSLVLAATAVLGALALVVETRSADDVNRLPAASRAGVFARARVDLRETCHAPEAASGALHDHCVDQASFVLLFAECDAGCVGEARALLPHSRR